MAVVKLTSENFEEEVLKADKPVFVDFFATWCAPCRMVAPSVEKLAADHDEIKVCQIDIDANQAIAMKYKVMSIPTFGLFKDGQLVDTAVGAVDYASLEKFATK